LPIEARFKPRRGKVVKESDRAESGGLARGIRTGDFISKEGRQEEATKPFCDRRKIGTELQAKPIEVECAQELDRGPSENTASICEQLYDPNDAKALTALEFSMASMVILKRR